MSVETDVEGLIFEAAKITVRGRQLTARPSSYVIELDDGGQVVATPPTGDAAGDVMTSYWVKEAIELGLAAYDMYQKAHPGGGGKKITCTTTTTMGFDANGNATSSTSTVCTAA